MSRKIILSIIFSFLQIIVINNLVKGNVRLYTPYTSIMVSPGESIEYSIEVINNSGSFKNIPLSLDGLPKGWSYEIKAGGWKIKQIAVLSGEKKTISLKIDVPYLVNKGIYRLSLASVGYTSLPLIIEVTKEGTSRSEFSCNTPSQDGHAGSTFTFNAELKNRSADRQVYTFSSEAPKGWDVIYKVNFKQVSSISIESGNTERITIEINPPDNIAASKYKIPIYASSSGNTATLDLEINITGTYKIELTTPRGLLSSNIIAGGEKSIELLVKNTGTSDLLNVGFDYTAPTGWEVKFEPSKIARIEAGKNTTAKAYIKADKKAIPGDYIVNIEAKTQEVNSKASFRMSVKTPLIYGWIGILIILGSLGIIYYLFKKYGRR